MPGYSHGTCLNIHSYGTVTEGLTKGSEFVEHDADSPDVTLVAIRFVIAQLRRHVVGCFTHRKQTVHKSI